MPIIVPSILYLKDDVFINGNHSIKCFLDVILAMIITLYSGKQLQYKDDNSPVTLLFVSVFYWKSHYFGTFRSFMMALCELFTYKQRIPFIHEKVTGIEPPVIKHTLRINTAYYDNLDAGFKFPNLNFVITELISRFMIKPCFEYEIRLLRFCKFEYPLDVFVSKKKDIKPEDVSNDIPLKLESRQLKQTNIMLSQMIEQIYTTMVNEDYTRLQAVIFETHAIYSSKKRGRSESEEMFSKKPTIESEEVLRLDNAPEYD